jgi:gamma-glutamyltranspeptidase/glutathione hydrolase
MNARSTSLLAVAALATAGALAVPADATPPPAADASAGRQPTNIGYGGAVSSVDPAATRIGLRVLRLGGNAVDAAIATAAALGVTEPYSAGIGGGGYFVFYNADKGKVQAIDGRETAPAGITPSAFVDPATGKPYNFTPELVTSGVSVGVPGTPATWDKAHQGKLAGEIARTVQKPPPRL